MKTLVTLLRDNNENQEKIMEILVEILSLSQVKNKDEAETRYQLALKKITELGSGVESMQTLIGLLTSAYNTVITFF